MQLDSHMVNASFIILYMYAEAVISTDLVKSNICVLVLVTYK